MDLTAQFKILDQSPVTFSEKIKEVLGADKLTGSSLKVFQVNLGRWCNQACKHCHVDASPIRTEDMTQEIATQCIEVIKNTPSIETVDITGGAPEGSRVFKYFVEESRKLGKHVIDRCNLTILEEPGFEWLYDFLLQHKVEIVSSLPHYAAASTDKQRGNGVFGKSITALKKLNSLGYGKDLPLNLVYNPVGIFLSAPQEQLQREFKEQLFSKYNIVFDNLYCINNIPMNRFLESLVRNKKFDVYMEKLINAYNPSTVEGLMCRHQISVGYEGDLFDCDFNQMLEMKAEPIGHLKDFNYETFLNREIKVHNHCFGCTAGSGSSCGGELV